MIRLLKVFTFFELLSSSSKSHLSLVDFRDLYLKLWARMFGWGLGLRVGCLFLLVSQLCCDSEMIFTADVNQASTIDFRETRQFVLGA